MWLIPAVLVGIALTSVALWSVRGQRHCPACTVPMTLLDTGAATPSYEVLICPKCANSATLAHGQRGGPARCPGCGHRAMVTPCIRLSDKTTPRVEIREVCGICSHARTRILPEDRSSSDENIVPFPPR